jgi:hypothetical protein
MKVRRICQRFPPSLKSRVQLPPRKEYLQLRVNPCYECCHELQLAMPICVQTADDGGEDAVEDGDVEVNDE